MSHHDLFPALRILSADSQAEDENLLEGLNPAQRQAVVHSGSPLLVVAGAGSGKTRVLTRRIAYLIASRGIHPGSILAITFTNKAAAEMKSRLIDLVGSAANSMWVTTFHSACVRILRAEIDVLGYRKNFSIYDDQDTKRLLTMICKEINLDTKKISVKQILNWISARKNKVEDDIEDERFKVFNEIYRIYQDRLQQANALDFDDLIVMTVRLFENCPDIKERYRRRFRHVLIDEYQDTNHAQYLLIRQLCEPSEPGDGFAIDAPELMVVGDSDQSIYAFRGATIRNIVDFEHDFPGAQTIVLEQNYRSTQTILSAANAVNAHNPHRLEKRLWCEGNEGEKIIGWAADSEYDEAYYVAQQIDAIADRGGLFQQIAVFYRTNAQSRAFEEVFIRMGIPYRVVGGTKFYERKEIRDVIAYLRSIDNIDDDVAISRIINVPKRGLGDRAQAAIEVAAAERGISIGRVIENPDQIEGLSSRAAVKVRTFAEMMARARQMVDEQCAAHEIVDFIVHESGLIDELRDANPQDQSRIDNIAEFLAVAEEFVRSATEIDLDREENDELSPELRLEAYDGDPSLSAFLERVALVADADQIPDGEDGEGMVTLMTLHTAKGLEFDTVFLTGMEDGIFPHERSRDNPIELQEERRLAYVGITRARKNLYITRAITRSTWGRPSSNPQSCFIAEIPQDLIEWHRVGRQIADYHTSQADRAGYDSDRQIIRPVKKVAVPLNLSVGTKVLHPTFGMGTVLALIGSGKDGKADIDFGSVGTKRLHLSYAPLERLS